MVWKDLIAAPSELPEGAQTDLSNLAERELSLEECAVLLALYRRISLTNPVLGQFVGKEKSQVYALKDLLFAKLQKYSDYLRGDNRVQALKILLDAVFSRLKSEKRACPFLKVVKTTGLLD